MLYIVEVENKRGEKATKEYEARSPDDLRRKVTTDLQGYPNIHVADIWMKGQQSIHISPGRG